MKQPTHFHGFPILDVTILFVNTSSTTSGHLIFFDFFFTFFLHENYSIGLNVKNTGFVIEILYFQKENKKNNDRHKT